MKFLRTKLTYANVVSTICLFLVLAGGAAYAATHLKKNSVGTKQLKNGAVTQKKISKAAQKALKGQTGPAGPTGPSGAGPAFSVTRDDRVQVTSLDIDDPTPLVTLTGLPAGSYAITAKTFLDTTGNEDLAKCRLLAPATGSGQDVDEMFVFMGIEFNGDSSIMSIPLQMLHTFPADGGSVRLACSHQQLELQAINPRIQAIRVTSATNTKVTG
jgi:hypothetical protein